MFDKNDPMSMINSAKKFRKPQSHAESDLQLQFCKWVSKHYPNKDFIRHEREKKRSGFSGQLMGIFNSLGGVPDWECLDASMLYHGLYLEFKRPGENWLDARGSVKKDYVHQYKFHQKSWLKGRPAFFVNDLEVAKHLFTHYISDCPMSKQIYQLPYDPAEHFTL